MSRESHAPRIVRQYEPDLARQFQALDMLLHATAVVRADTAHSALHVADERSLGLDQGGKHRLTPAWAIDQFVRKMAEEQQIMLPGEEA